MIGDVDARAQVSRREPNASDQAFVRARIPQAWRKPSRVILCTDPDIAEARRLRHLLCVRAEHPHRNTAEKDDELPPSQMIQIPFDAIGLRTAGAFYPKHYTLVRVLVPSHSVRGIPNSAETSDDARNAGMVLSRGAGRFHAR
jgi:hypothetical protein